MSSTQRKRINNGKNQPTLEGLWKSKSNEDEQPESSAVGKKRSRDQDSTSTTMAPTKAPPLRLNNNSNPLWENVSLPNGPMLLLRGCIGGKKASERRCTREAVSSLPDWNDNVTFQIYSKECKMRRRICQYSTNGKISYSYSGLENVVAPKFPQILCDIKLRVEELICDHILQITKEGAVSSKNLSISPEFGDILKSVKKGEEVFNYCLCNHYRDGEEYMGYHADDEGSLDPYAPIASVSLGITRNFDVRPRVKDSKGKRSRVARIALGDGDLLLMLPPMQTHYQHAIPVEKRIAGERINLTFRRVITS